MLRIATVSTALSLSAIAIGVLPGIAQPQRVPESGRPEFTPSPQSIVSTSVIGARVLDTTGKDRGEIEQLLIEPSSGHVRYAVLGLGGLAGVGERKVVVKWSDLRLRPDDVNPRRTIASIDPAAIDRAALWKARTDPVAPIPAAASPPTFPPGPVPPPAPGTRY
jgi:hypothetical protein